MFLFDYEVERISDNFVANLELMGILLKLGSFRIDQTYHLKGAINLG